jgi:O-antigen ligase
VVASVGMFIGITSGRVTFRVLAVVGTTAAIAAIAIVGVTSSIAGSLRLGSLESGGGRAEVLPDVIDAVEQRPILGYGYGSSQEIFESFGELQVGSFTGLYSGNVFLDAALELGLIGVVGLLATLVLALWRLRGVTVGNSYSDRLGRYTWLAVVLGGMANAQGESFLLRPGGVSAPIFWFGLAMCSAIGYRLRQERQALAPQAPATDAFAAR